MINGNAIISDYVIEEDSNDSEECRRLINNPYSINQFVALLEDAKKKGFDDIKIFSDYGTGLFILFIKTK